MKPLTLSPTDLYELLQSGTAEDVQGQLFALPATSMRADQPLHRHQADALDALKTNGGRSGIFHLPTGAGKTRIALELIARRLHSNRRTRVIWATYPRVLILQAMARLAEVANIFPEGVRFRWATGDQVLNDKDLIADAEVTFLMREDLSTLVSDAGDLRVSTPPLAAALEGAHPSGCPRVTLVYDECQQLAAAGLQRAWRKFSKTRSGESRFDVFGFSATPLPTDPHRHTLLKENIFPVGGAPTVKPEWEVMVHHSVDAQKLVDAKILCPINLTLNDDGLFTIPPGLLRDAGIEKLARHLGTSKKDLHDFEEGFNNKVLSDSAVLEFLATRLADNLPRLGKTLVFAPNIAAANQLSQFLKRKLAKADVSVVHSRLDEFEDHLVDESGVSATEVQAQISAFKRRGDRPCVMVNVGMLTTGFDDPKIKSVLLARLTFSTNLFWQMIGRGTRGPNTGGTRYCNVIDPIRMTDRFAFLKGYRPALENGHYLKHESAEVGVEALRPGMPCVREATTPGDGDPAISRELRSDIAILLRGFLGGAHLDAQLLASVAVKNTIAVSGEMTSEFVNATPKVPAAPGFFFDRRIQETESALRLRHPEVDLLWLQTMVPPVVSDASISAFEQKLDIVKRRSLLTADAYYVAEADALKQMG